MITFLCFQLLVNLPAETLTVARQPQQTVELRANLSLLDLCKEYATLKKKILLAQPFVDTWKITGIEPRKTTSELKSIIEQWCALAHIEIEETPLAIVLRQFSTRTSTSWMIHGTIFAIATSDSRAWRIDAEAIIAKTLRLGVGTFVPSATAGQLFAEVSRTDYQTAIKFLASDSRTKASHAMQVLATDDGQQSRVFSGETRPVTTSSDIVSNNNFVRTNVDRLQFGVGLTAKIITTEYGAVIDIELIEESVSGSTLIGNALQPITAKRQIQSRVLATDGNTFLIGGSLSETADHSRQGIPVRPLWGLFGNSKNKAQLDLWFLGRIEKQQTQQTPILHQTEKESKQNETIVDPTPSIR